MTLELVSHTLCPYVHRAATMIHEKGVPCERRYIDLQAKPDWFLAISPRGKVPVLLVDGRPLFESLAIMEFIDETHPPSLMGSDPFQRARQRAWVAMADDLAIAQYRLLTAASREDQEAAAQAVGAVAAHYEQALADGVLAPTGFDLAHLALGPAALRFTVVEAELGVRVLQDAPRLEALARRLAARPSVARTVPDDFAALFVAKLVERGSLLAAARR